MLFHTYSHLIPVIFLYACLTVLFSLCSQVGGAETAAAMTPRPVGSIKLIYQDLPRAVLSEGFMAVIRAIVDLLRAPRRLIIGDNATC